MTTERARIERVYRGQRVAAVREALGLTGAEFAGLLRSRLRGKYDKAKVSRMESGLRDVSLVEAVVIMSL